ncbi:MAG: ABC transporter substrate-binding protein [Bryobacteraceae bacterium]|nr:ABC transporter substrate-binding protein [Bryobacteraceae bacterium]
MNRRTFVQTLPAAAVATACSRRTAGEREVAFAMWGGDEERNHHFRGPVAEDIRRRFNIRLRLVTVADTAEFITKLITEKHAGRTEGGSADIVWMNGENFRSARQAGILWGPFAESLSNIALYPASTRLDFGTPTDGFEAPWQKAQFVFAWDPARTALPAGLGLDGLFSWLRQHPGRFTYVAPPDFTGSAFIRHVLLAYGERIRFADFDREFYEDVAPAALKRLLDIRPFLWRRGETYPATARELDRLFANNEIDLSMNYNPAFASVRIARGEFPATVRTFVLLPGTLFNYSYLAIPFNAAAKDDAKAVIDHMLSFDAQLALSREVQSPFPIEVSRLDPARRAQVEALPREAATLSDSWLAAHALPEPHADYLIQFERDWQAEVLRA